MSSVAFCLKTEDEQASLTQALSIQRQKLNADNKESQALPAT
jgi:hypothetical protein